MSNADHSVAMVALLQHPGYNYDGVPYQIVSAGQKFNVTPARAARLLAKGIAKLEVFDERVEFAVTTDPLPPGSPMEWSADPMEPEPEPVKVDKRTKAYKESKSK